MTLSKSNRRYFLKASLGGALGVSLTSLFDERAFAAGAKADEPSMIVLWMNGGPSQLDTFDPKPKHPNGGQFKPIRTAVAGIQVSEHLPQVAKQMKHLAVVRSMSSKEGSHPRGRYLMHTGYLPTGSVTHPTFGSVVSSELGQPGATIPSFISITLPSLGPGILGMTHAAFHVPKTEEGVPNAAPAAGIDTARFNRRLGMLSSLERNFVREKRGDDAMHHVEVYQKGVRLMRSPSLQAFDLDKERDPIRDAYGRNEFGQGCLMARRLIEAGVKCVEVTLDGWDSHLNNFNKQRGQMEVLDPAMGTLVSDLSQRGLLKNTLVVWLGEFGRTPKINVLGGRDHFPKAWSAVLAGGGIAGGQVIGKTSPDGNEVIERPVTPPELFATFCKSLGLNPSKENLSGNGRPVPLTNNGTAIGELFG